MICDNLASVERNIRDICAKVGRNPEEIILVGVSKYSSIDQIREGIAAGLIHLGENRVSEAVEKFEILKQELTNVKKHFIGHLQTNKVKKAIDTFDLIESVDSVRLLNAIENQAQKEERTVDVLIQLNMAQEDQKTGLNPDLVFDLFDQACNLNYVKILGLMTMAPLTEDRSRIRHVFKGLKDLSDTVVDKYKDSPQILMKYLSMGMTNDYDLAIEEGANMIRIGRAIFNYE